MSDSRWNVDPRDERFSPEEVISDHERATDSSPSSAEHSRPSEREEAPPLPDGESDARPQRSDDLPNDEGRDARSRSSSDVVRNDRKDHGRDEPNKLEDTAERVLPLVLAKIDQHTHLPIQVPNVDALEELKRRDPKAYRFWFKQIRKQQAHEMWMEKAPFRTPATVSRNGQIAGLLAVAVMACLVAYVAYLDHPWLAGVLGVLDFVGLAAIFAKGDDPQ